MIKTPYRDDINYATLNKEDLRNEIVPIKNRYLNAVHHLDSQFARVFAYLKEKNLLDSTIVILLGDHGEEFMEHGYWGHNSTFVNEQIRTPLVIWMPGQAPKTFGMAKTTTLKAIITAHTIITTMKANRIMHGTGWMTDRTTQ